MKTLSVCLAQSMSPDPAVRKPAEDFIRNAETQKNFSLVLLRVVAKEDADMTVRVAGAVAFKNFVKRNWKVVSKRRVVV